MKIEISQTSELISNRLGLLQLQSFIEYHKLNELVDKLMPQSLSNHSYRASHFVTTLLHIILDGATVIDDVRMLQQNHAYQIAAGLETIPSANAIGDWLLRIGGAKKLYALKYGMASWNGASPVVVRHAE